jgi:hypothetical protein
MLRLGANRLRQALGGGSEGLGVSLTVAAKGTFTSAGATGVDEARTGEATGSGKVHAGGATETD